MITALVIDDLNTNLILLERFLQMEKIRAICVESGEEGYSVAREQQPDIILTDLIMPRATWDGYQTVEQLKADPGTKHIPILAITAIGDEQRARAAGCDEIMYRPFHLKTLQKRLHELLAQARQ